MSKSSSVSLFSRMNIRQKSANPGTTYAEDERAGFNFYLVGDFFYDIAEEGGQVEVNKTNVSVYNCMLINLQLVDIEKN